SARPFTERIRANLERLDHATALIYDLASPQRRIEPAEQRAPVDLAPLIDSVLDEIAQQRAATTCGVAHHAPAAPIRIRARQEALRIVLQNLLCNAVEAAEGGKVEVAYGDRSASEIEMRVTNPGTLDRDVIGDIAPTRGSNKPGGLGLGLFIAR